MTEVNKRIADRTRGIAAEHRFTQERIAETLGISRTSVAERAAGRVAYSAAEIFTLATAMRVPVSRFFPELDAYVGERAS